MVIDVSAKKANYSITAELLMDDSFDVERWKQARRNLETKCQRGYFVRVTVGKRNGSI